MQIGNELETLVTNGPAGGGAWTSAREVLAVASVLLRRELAKPQVLVLEPAMKLRQLAHAHTGD